ncbi:molybdopterin synthase sulfur carrier subunit [Marinobacterium zhoushanense]|uniref:Molybdopterin synthase sulfur carrier subunit n=1 Tax=Marinobacterium zhoushanense TaxID=1679163 RepID=A0ABQ1KJS2_9GAMM|nr:molybdopterin converting factor subunit 1 [Marinobacterium zhoushanense]GGB99350.1 molybdopterin synthase sulfur carrier subunit [Marinobacterium zhoushanense]
MLILKYFASLREQLARDEEHIALPAQVTTLAELIEHLGTERDECWLRALTATPVVTAVNQEVCGPEQRICDGDEIAFFPPVTGG